MSLAVTGTAGYLPHRVTYGGGSGEVEPSTATRPGDRGGPRVTAAALFAGGLAAGLVAGTASCTAVQGGILIGLIRRRAGTAHRHPAPTGGHRSRSPEGAGVVAAFVGGRLVSHTVAGGLLGLLGDSVRLPPPARAVLLLGAGTAVVVYAVRVAVSTGRPPPACAGQIATPVPEPEPAEPSGAVAERAVARPDRRGVGRAGVLGAATVLIPCGVTLSMQAVAVSSGSWAGGAAVMAGFVAGTAPGFALLGLLVRRVTSRRLAALAAAGALVAGVVTVAAGLRLAGWLPAWADPAATSGVAARTSDGASGTGDVAGAATVVRADGTQVLTIWATPEGFRPGVTAAQAGRPMEIVFRTAGNRGCTRTLTVQGHDVTLPESGERAVRLPPQGPGRLRYVCGMGMYVGFINITEQTPAAR
ncbi:sulfite exporter TauE/SafE family protein [Sphaerisporangium melleum]|uniref:sulfite exporter TauE/SafE family protein n=1 Tax=Sphaerisporangium melleum TaxID=321316 RepID=UPI00166F2F7B|nr:sulfite exporter TauE/SafE family protein [Sphaerisporangium melleum]